MERGIGLLGGGSSQISKKIKKEIGAWLTDKTYEKFKEYPAGLLSHANIQRTLDGNVDDGVTGLMEAFFYSLFQEGLDKEG